jgi:soluble lytic murein transglycosylase-like protein
MPHRKTIAIIAPLVAAISVFMGMRERSDRTDTLPDAAFVSHERLPGVMVFARRPSLSEIIRLVLRERPTAAEITGTNAMRDGFPEGSDEARVAGVLSRRTRNRMLANRIAAAIVKEARKRNIGSSLIVGVILTENPWLDPRATSAVGARGLMQVMPFHAGRWGCGSRDLFDVESNICHGVAVLADNLYRSRTLPQALLGYNGCVRGTNTPDCWKYPGIVHRRAPFESGGI